MHTSSYIRMNYLLDWYRPYFERKDDNIKVLDIGSYGSDRTYRDFFYADKYVYHGLDMAEGPNVDIVPKDIYSWNEIEDNSYDLVISGQVFEHIEYPWLTIKEIERVLKPSGFCIIIAPNAGLEHKAPKDCYRYYSDGLCALAKWADLYVHHTSVAGVPRTYDVKEWKSIWNDAVIVAQKKPVENRIIEDPLIYEQRWLQDGLAIITYKNYQIAVHELKKKYPDDKKYILYGAGLFGTRFFNQIGGDNVYCFCDGNKEKVGNKYNNKDIISLDTLKKIHHDYHVVVTVNYVASVEICKTLKQNGILFESLYWVEA